MLLIGRHGVGKSELVEQAAKALGISCICRDLSIMEPPDLAGIPTVNENSETVYAPPAFLPKRGKGLLMFEELNRCPLFMRAPCLQLLTARTLNDYRLPHGWLPMAAINPPGDEYQVDEIDAALLARFMQIEVIPDSVEWLKWARNDGDVHDKVSRFVEQTPKIFDSPDSNPRSWTYLSRLVKAWERNGRDKEILVDGLAGVVGESMAVAFNQFYQRRSVPLEAAQILKNYDSHRDKLLRWVKESQLDLIAASVELTKKYLTEKNYQSLNMPRSRQQKRNVRLFFYDLPPDLKRSMRRWLKDQGYTQLTIPRTPTL